MKKDARLQIRLPQNLKKRLQEYVDRHHTDLSSLVVRLLTRLLEEDERRKNPPDAEQI